MKLESSDKHISKSNSIKVLEDNCVSSNIQFHSCNQSYINSWSRFTSWQNVTPPSRPSETQIMLCRKHLEGIARSCPVAVLGSTIEYREMLANMGFNSVTIFEKNVDFYNYITPFARCSLKETLVAGDWLESLFNYHKYFDVVLSDLTSGNIPYQFRDTFYAGISKSLTPNGLFLDRILTKPIPFIPLSDLITKYKFLEVDNRTTNSFNCEVIFCSDLLDNEQHIVDTNIFYDKLFVIDIPRISEFVKACYNITPRNCTWWYSIDWSTESLLYEKYWNIQKTYDEPTSSEYFDRVKLIISRGRK